MNCPACSGATLHNEELEENISAKACSKCGGRWIPSYQYWKWRDRVGKSSGGAVSHEQEPAEAVNDSGAGKLCPECGHFLTRCKVGHGLEFMLDRCTNCGGIWLDKNEWESLAAKKLQNQIHFIFSDSWQRQVRDEESRETHQKRIETIIGAQDWNKLKDVIEWIRKHSRRETIVGYIEEELRKS